MLSFNSKQEIKESYIDSILKWLESKKQPKSAEQLASEIFSTVREYSPSDCVLENYEDFPTKLGLPMWIGNLLFTFNHLNSNDFHSLKGNYEEKFYPDFLESCKVGIDYTFMYHEWELVILTEMLPKEYREKNYFKKLITLHQNAIDQRQLNLQKWKDLKSIVENDMKNNSNQIEWDASRVVFLSIENTLDNNAYHTSLVALIDVLTERSGEVEKRKEVCIELMNKLLVMLKKWN